MFEQFKENNIISQSSPGRRDMLRGFSNANDSSGSDFGIFISTSSSRDSVTPPPRLYGQAARKSSLNSDLELNLGHRQNQQSNFTSERTRSTRNLYTDTRSSNLHQQEQFNSLLHDSNRTSMRRYGSVPILNATHVVDGNTDLINKNTSLPKATSTPQYVPLAPPLSLTMRSSSFQKGEKYSHDFLPTHHDPHQNLESAPTSTQETSNSNHNYDHQPSSSVTTPKHNNVPQHSEVHETQANSSKSELKNKLNSIFAMQLTNTITPVKRHNAGLGIPDRSTSLPVSSFNVSQPSHPSAQKLVSADIEPFLVQRQLSQILKAQPQTLDPTINKQTFNTDLRPSMLLQNNDQRNLAHNEEIRQVMSIRRSKSAVDLNRQDNVQTERDEDQASENYNPEPDYPDSESGIYFDASTNNRDKQKDYDASSANKISDQNSKDNNRKEEEEEEEDDLTWRPYDVFTVSERESDDDNIVFKEILKVIRSSLYFFFVIIILVGTVSSRISLFLLASGISQSKESKGESVVFIIICICAPMMLSWVNSFMKILFGGKEWPSIKTFAVVMFFELVCTFGICLLVFKILPSTDFFRGITITFAMFQIPSILKFMMLESQHKCNFKAMFKTCASLLAVLAQCGGLVYFMVIDFSVEKYDKTLTGHDYSKETPLPSKTLHEFVWELPVALILVSLGWWENYVSCDWSLFGRVKLRFKRWRHVLQETRETCNFLVTPFKIALVVILGKYLADADFALPVWSRATKKTPAVFHGVSFSLLYIQLGSAVLCTHLAGLACKLHMQKAAFAFPLLLSPPVSLVVIYLQCSYQFLPVSWHSGLWYCPNLNIENLIQPIAVSGTLWFSYCIIVSHVWFPQSERMAKIEKLFLTPHLSAIFPDFNLTLRRRRNDKELKTTHLNHYTYTDEDTGHVPQDIPHEDSHITPTIYVCATMWHETKREMTQLLKSLFRLDYGHCASKLAQAKFNIRDPDYFDMEIHIIFDDAFELDDVSNRYVPNIFVHQFIQCLEEAARSVVKGFIIIPSPVKVVTPYGGRLIWTMPGQTKMVVHMKDKNKIRHRKRWSQVMYLYYLLGFRLLGYGDGSDVKEEEKTHHHNTHLRHRKKKKGGHNRNTRTMPLKQLLMRVPPEEYEQIIETSENTFILTLDGDVDFKPDSVKLLVDRMKKNKKVGAVCGRIHPIGSGPMVWYQQFEYAIGHWLQKAAEHVLGCVLCCPGCFSLFRGSAIMDDNVLKMYTTKPTEARHFIQFEQGEDRWLCTLLLQQGHRIDYSAGADALTFAPESFFEFFNQRRRWSPSTLANMMDLLASWRETVRLNDNISRFYVLYQFTLMASSILAPSTVILMITSSYHTVLGLSNWWSFVLSMIPVAIYVIVCLTQKTDTQIKIGAVLTAIYTVIMMIATVGTFISIATENFSSPNVVFLSGLGIIFVTAALLHPQEIDCLVFGAIYFLVVPSTFILLTIFYLCNLNNVSWGTREMPKKMTLEEEEAIKLAEEEKKKKKKSWNIFTAAGIMNIVNELRELLKNIWGLRNELQHNQNSNQLINEQSTHKLLPQKEEKVELPSKENQSQEIVGYEPDPDNPYWFHLEEMGSGPIEELTDAEIDFWNFLIKKYLYPLDENKEQKEKIAKDLLEVRNNVVFIFIMMNFLWTVIALQLQASEDILKDYYIIQKYEPMSLLFLTIFGLIMVIQFIGMILHRWGTFLHLMSSTRIDWFSGAHSDEDFARFVVQEIQKHQNLEPSPDYAEEEDEDEDDVSLPSNLEEAPDDDDDIYSLPASMRQSYTNQMVWPRNWNHRPSNPGHFPRYENILDHKLGRLQQQLNRVGSSHRGHNVMSRQLSKKETRFFNRWSSKDANMRQKFIQQNFQLPHQPPSDKLTSVSVM